VKALLPNILLVIATAAVGLYLLIELQRLDAIRFEQERAEWNRTENQKREALKEEIITEVIRRVSK
jgi:hypothetical protein